MKTKSFILIALAMVAALTMVFCECSSKLDREQKLSDSVLAKLDSLADEYFTAHEKGIHFRRFELTKQEKLVKPNYLLDPSKVEKFTTKSQKINALAIYIIELGVREIYDMPTEQAREAIAKVVADLNYPYDIDQRDSNMSKSERRKQEYNKCKENGILAEFWQFQNAILCETNYILAQNPELFFSKISEENLMAYNQEWASLKAAIRELAKYDEEMKEIMNTSFFNPINEISDEELRNSYFKDVNTAKETYKSNKLNQIEKRNALLQ